MMTESPEEDGGAEDATIVDQTATADGPNPASLGCFSDGKGFLYVKQSEFMGQATPRGRRKTPWARVWCELSAQEAVLRYRLVDQATSFGARTRTSTPTPDKVVSEKPYEVHLARCGIAKLEPKQGEAQKYVVVNRATLRKEVGLKSDSMGTVEPGEFITPTKREKTKDGRVRIKFTRALQTCWVSVTAKDGRALLAPAGRPFCFIIVPPAAPGDQCAAPGNKGAEDVEGVEDGAAEPLCLQAESATDLEAWTGALRAAAVAATERAQGGLSQAITTWLAGIPIGGREQRAYDPSGLINFAWESGLEAWTPEQIYKAYVETVRRLFCVCELLALHVDVLLWRVPSNRSARRA